MAFPDDSGRYCEVTVDSANISATLNGFVLAIFKSDVPADMLDAGSNSCLNGGGDIRAGNDDGTTRFPLNVVRCVTNATASSRELELHVGVSENIPSGSDYTCRLYYKEAAATQPAANTTYGSESVYDSDYELVSHDGGKTNATSGSNPSVFTTEPSAASGKEDDTDARDYGSRTEIEGYSLGITGTTEYTYEHQIYSRSVDANAEISFYRIDFSGFTSERFGYQFSDEFWLTDGSNYLGGTLANITEDTWHMVSLAQDGGSDGEIYVDGSSVYSGSALNAPSTAETSLFMGVAGTGSNELDGLIGEVRYSKIRRSDAWINATAELLNDHSNFYNHTPTSYSNATAYTMTAAAGTFAFTGRAADLNAGRYLSLSKGSFTLSGKAVGLAQGYLLTAAQGSFSLSGKVAGLSAGRYLSAVQGSFTVSGKVAGLSVSRLITAAQGSFSLSGYAATLTYTSDKTLTANKGSFTVSGKDADLLALRTMSAAQGGFTVTGRDAGLNYGRYIDAANGSFSVTGYASDLLYGRSLGAVKGAFSVTGYTAGLIVARQLVAETNNFSLSGYVAGLSYGSDKTLIAAKGSFTLTGRDAAFTVSRNITADQGAFSLTGQDANLHFNRRLIAVTSSFAVTGYNAGFARGLSLSGDKGVYTLTGYDSAVNVSRLITLDKGSFTLNGIDAGLRRSLTIVASTQRTRTLSARQSAAAAERNRISTVGARQTTTAQNNRTTTVSSKDRTRVI